MYKNGKENRMSRVSLPDYEGGSLEEYMYLIQYSAKYCTIIRKHVKKQESICRLKLPKEDWLKSKSNLKSKGSKSYLADLKRKRDKLKWLISNKSMILTNIGTTRWWTIKKRQRRWRLKQSKDMKMKWYSLKRKLRDLYVSTRKNQEKSLISEKYKKIWQNKRNI